MIENFAVFPNQLYMIQTLLNVFVDPLFDIFSDSLQIHWLFNDFRVIYETIFFPFDRRPKLESLRFIKESLNENT